MLSITNHHGNICQNPNEISPQYLGWPLLKYKTNIAEDAKKRGPLCIIGVTLNRCSHYGKQYKDHSKKLKLELPYDSAVKPPLMYWKELKS